MDIITEEIKLLVFDWDGTLMDSEGQIVSCMQAAIADLKLASRTPEQIKDIIGLGLQEAVSTLFPGEGEELAGHLAAQYREHWLSQVDECSLFPGVTETLDLLRGEDFLLAVATGKGRVGLDKSLRTTGLEEHFHATRCADETRSKPHPQMLLEIIEELGVEASQTVMIGDTEYDMHMARNANAHPVAVSYGVHCWDRLQQHDPVVCLDQITDINDWLAERRQESTPLATQQQA